MGGQHEYTSLDGHVDQSFELDLAQDDGAKMIVMKKAASGKVMNNCTVFERLV